MDSVRISIVLYMKASSRLYLQNQLKHHLDHIIYYPTGKCPSLVLQNPPGRLLPTSFRPTRAKPSLSPAQNQQCGCLHWPRRVRTQFQSSISMTSLVTPLAFTITMKPMTSYMYQRLYQSMGRRSVSALGAWGLLLSAPLPVTSLISLPCAKC